MPQNERFPPVSRRAKAFRCIDRGRSISGNKVYVQQKVASASENATDSAFIVSPYRLMMSSQVGRSFSRTRPPCACSTKPLYFVGMTLVPAEQCVKACRHKSGRCSTARSIKAIFEHALRLTSGRQAPPWAVACLRWAAAFLSVITGSFDDDDSASDRALGRPEW